MSAEMERVVREEKFLKEQPYRLDNALRYVFIHLLIKYRLNKEHVLGAARS